jgi:SAM-dependent methyltransferase
LCARVIGDALEIGCGGGGVAALLEREGHRVVAADPARAGALPFDDGDFDTVLLGGFLAEWVSRERPIAEARLIVAVPYAAGPDDDGVSLRELLGDLGEFSVGEIATVEGRLCLLAERTREKSRAAVWRRALAVAEERLAEREGEAAALAASVAALEASGEREERTLADARGDVERLEAALAAATHERDLQGEAARLAGDGVAELEQRLEGLGRDAERERAEAERERERLVAEAERSLADARGRLDARKEELEHSRTAAQEAQHELVAMRERLGGSERELAAVRKRLRESEDELVAMQERLGESEGKLGQAGKELMARERELEVASAQLEARERYLETARLGVKSRDRKLAVADRALESRDAELGRLRSITRERERELALAEARLEKAQLRAERFRGSLVALREGRAYRLMRVLWRLRRPFKRAPRDAAAADAPIADDADSAPPAAAAPSPPLLRRPSVATAERKPPRPQGGRLRVASILDEMSEACFAPECDLVPLALGGWREQLDQRPPDLLLVESAWNGNGGEWQYRIAQYPREDLAGLPALRALLAGCRERGIPTAFWNKEDPVHFDRFAEAASLFDHVFTTDARCVERYRGLPGERTVAPLPFAAQPRIHNPAAAVTERSASSSTPTRSPTRRRCALGGSSSWPPATPRSSARRAPPSRPCSARGRWRRPAMR